MPPGAAIARKKLTSELAKAAETLPSSAKPVPITKVENKAAERFNVEGFPTLKFFVNGEAIDFNAGCTAKDIVSWITKRVGQVSTLISDQSALDSFIKDSQVAVIYFGHSESDAHWAAFKSLAMSEDKLAFAHVFNDEVTANQKTTSGSVVISKKNV
jgi:protein disulfide-isomerase A1